MSTEPINCHTEVDRIWLVHTSPIDIHHLDVSKDAQKASGPAPKKCALKHRRLVAMHVLWLR
jgi:hypothetical protein